MNIGMYLAILSLVLLCDYGRAQDKFVSCSEVESYCASRGRSLTAATGPPAIGSDFGRPGKAGAKGDRGDPGQSGPPGPPGLQCEVDESAIEARIMAKIKFLMSSCRIVYNETCFFVVGSAGHKYGKEDLQRMCSDRGANLANVYGEDHRLKLNQYVRTETTAYAELILGMTYEPQSNTFRSHAGEIIQVEASWHPSYPKTAPSHFMMFLAVRTTAGDSNQGIFNYTPYGTPFGLCEWRFTF